MNWMSRLLTEPEQGLEPLGKGLGRSRNSTRSSFSAACLTIVALLAICSVPICSLAQEQRLSQYAHRAWLMRDGFFSGSPTAITQTTDGYIWIGTSSGLFRFDGSRFDRWSSPDGKKLPSELIYGLLGARDGSLWIGMRVGLAHFVDRKLVVYSDFHDNVAGMIEDRSGNIWFTRTDPGGALKTPVCQALPTKIHCLDESDGFTTKSCCPLHLAQDTEGYIWVPTEGPLLRWKPGHFESYLPKEWASTKGIETVGGVIGMPDGSVLVCVQHTGAFGGLQKLSMGHWESVKVPGFDGSKVDGALTAFRDNHAGIWLGTGNHGIYHIHGNEFEKFGIQDGLSGDYVLGFYQDRENGIWVVTSGGVDYFRPRKITTFSMREGLSGDIVDAVTAGRDNVVWFGAGSGMDLLKNGHIDKIRPDQGFPGFLAMFEDSFGRIWCGINNDLYRYDSGKFQRVQHKSGDSTHFIVGITEDSAHDIWAEVSGGSHELIHIHDLRVVEEYPEALIPSARALAAGPNGVLWLGLRNGDLARFHDGHAEVFPSPGGPKSHAYQVLVNSDSTVFATTSAGLVGWKNGASHLLSSKNGLPCDLVIGAESDNNGSLWLYTGCGVARIDKEEMNRWWRDDTSIVTPQLLDAFDGAETGGIPNFNPMARTPDGRLWIANRHMLEAIDPAHLTQNDVVPPVQIEKVVGDRKPYEPKDRLVLPARLRDLEIDYAGLSFVNPQKVRFRYRLEGRDMAWQEAGGRRQAFYTDLPPGSYRFRVIACNNDGVWNETGAQLAFTIPPAFTQSIWFKVICLLGFMGFVYAAYRFRVRQVTLQLRGRMYERLAERERIARDLHDTFFQGIQGLLLRFHTATSQLSKEEPARRIFEETLKQSDQVMLEGRELVLDLRATASEQNDLPTAFSAFGEGMRRGSSCDFRVVVSGAIRSLHPVVFEELFKIGKEALSNAFRHSGAHSIEAELNYERSELCIRIRDDGTGIDSTILRQGHRHGHFGLPGMRERAEKVGAHLDVWSKSAAGTEVELRIAARIAYLSERNGSIWKLPKLWHGAKQEGGPDENGDAPR
jgi:signal transduction histidine kinase/ligand-binding sensor domain-containing protein